MSEAAEPLHSMSSDERSLALEVLVAGWQRAAAGRDLVAAIDSSAATLTETHLDVSADYARHLAAAAIWYLDRAVRRIAAPDLDGHTPAQRAANLAWFAESATAADLERLFAMASALNADDV